MTRIIIGGTAAEHLGVATRTPKDLDVFSPVKNPGEDAFWDDRLREWFGEEERYATLDELVTIKQSHAYWNLDAWPRHIADMQRLKDAGGVVIDELHDLLYNVWVDHHGAKRVDLNQDSAEFFADGVRREFDHDSLHRSVAYTPGAPIYEQFLIGSVQMDMEAVWASDRQTQIRLFREETYATALERFVIPSGYTVHLKAANARALRLMLTSLTKGRSARFCADNFTELNHIDHDYVAHHRANADYLLPYKRGGYDA